MRTEFLLRLNQQAKKRLRKKFGNQVFDQAIVQQILGFNKKGSTVIDRLQNVQMEYDYLTDIGSSLFFLREFEQAEIHFLIQKMSDKHQTTILDIGANIGWHSVLWAKALPNSKIFAFEPAPDTYALLRRNIDRNSLNQQIYPISKAVSNEPGILPFFRSKDNAYSSLKDTKRREILDQISVPVTTIDEFVETHQLTEISLIKIDVEGLETQVVQGGLTTLDKFAPDLFVEIYGGQNSNPDPEATIQLISSLGYKSFVMKNAQISPYHQHSDLYYNYYFTRR
jgi:FkbM family methyltransferase